MKWRGWRHKDHAKAEAERAEAKLRQVRRATTRIEQIADRQSIPDDEFADMVADVFKLRRRPT